MDEVEFHAPPRESKSKRWLSFHPFSGIYIHIVSIHDNTCLRTGHRGVKSHDFKEHSDRFHV